MKKIILAMICFVLVGCSYPYEAEVIKNEDVDGGWCRSHVTTVKVTKGYDGFLTHDKHQGQVLSMCGYYGEVGDSIIVVDYKP